MNNKILVTVYVPIIEMNCDLFIPINKKICNITNLIYDLVSEISYGSMPKDKNLILVDRKTGLKLRPELSVKKSGLINGSEIVLI